MNDIVLILLVPVILVVLLLLFWIFRGFRDKKKISNARNQAIKNEKKNKKRSDYFKKVIYDLCQPDEYFHEFLGANNDDFRKVTKIIVEDLNLPYETIKNKNYYSAQDLKNLYLTIDRNLAILNNQYHIEAEYGDIPVLFQHLSDLLAKIDYESIIVLNNKTISILSEIRENGKCYCFCVEIDIDEGPVSKGNGYSILETDIKKTEFMSLGSSMMEQELLTRFKDKSRRVRVELDNIAEKQRNNPRNGTENVYSNSKTYGNSSNQQRNSSGTSQQHSRSTNNGSYSYAKSSQNSSYQGGRTNQNNNSSSGYNNYSRTSSQNGSSGSNNTKSFNGNKNELEVFISNMAKSNKYYSYFIGCKTFTDVKKRRNELVKQFHPDMGASNDEEIIHINPIFEELKKKFGNSKF